MNIFRDSTQYTCLLANSSANVDITMEMLVNGIPMRRKHIEDSIEFDRISENISIELNIVCYRSTVGSRQSL